MSELLNPKLTLVVPSPQPPADKPIMLVTFNVHFGKKVLSLRQLFEEHEFLSKADIILFQEIEDHRVEGVARAERVAQSLGYHCVYAPARRVSTKGTHGLAILSRYPIENFEIIQLGFFKQLFRSRQRIALNCTIRIGERLVQVCNVHLDVRLNIQDRIAQVAPVLNKLKQAYVDGTILAGDLNMTPLRWTKGGIPLFYTNQKKKFTRYLQANQFVLQTTHLGATMARGFLRMHLDGIATHDLTVLASGICEDVELSDHRPIWMRFTV